LDNAIEACKKMQKTPHNGLIYLLRD